MMRPIGLLLVYLLAILAMVVAAYPYVYMVLTALKPQSEFLRNPIGLPTTPTLSNFKLILTPEFGRYFTNSVVVSIVCVSATLVLAAMASYPLSRMRFRLNRSLFLFFTGGMMIPVHTTLIPLYVMTVKLGYIDTIYALMGPYVAFSLPISIFILTEFFREIPEEILEAARIDGCSSYRTFLSILVPLATPALVTVAIYNFIFVWNEFIFALVLTSSPSSQTLPLGLRNFYGEFMVNVPGMMAALTLATLPVLIFYFLAQEKVIKGLTAGAIKG